MSAVDAFCNCLLFVVFAVALASKVHSRRAFAIFAAGLEQFGIRGVGALSTVLAALVPLVEFSALVSLSLIGVSPKIRYAIPAALLVVFAIALLVAARHRQTLVCHCFGSTTSSNVRVHVTTNLFLAGLALWASLVDLGRQSSGAVLLGAGMGVIAAIILTTFETLTQALAVARKANQSSPTISGR